MKYLQIVKGEQITFCTDVEVDLKLTKGLK